MKRNSIELGTAYGYKGANCCVVVIKEREDGYYDASNDYGEVMLSCFHGAEVLAKLIHDLKEGVYA